MYFVTDEPKLFNIETGVSLSIRPMALGDDIYGVSIQGVATVYKGTEQECEDFIYTIAGMVKAKNPTGHDKATIDCDLLDALKTGADCYITAVLDMGQGYTSRNHPDWGAVTCLADETRAAITKYEDMGFGNIVKVTGG